MRKLPEIPLRICRALSGQKSVLPLLLLLGCAPMLLGPIYQVYRGLEGLEQQSDGVAIVRVLPYRFTPTPGDPIDLMWTDGEGIVTAEVLGSLKGDLQGGTTVTIQLRILSPDGAHRGIPASAIPERSREPLPGVYLMFLKRGGVYGGWVTVRDGRVHERSPRSGEKVDWQAVNTAGNVLALRNPQPPYALKPGETIIQAVKRLLEMPVSTP